MHSQRDIDHYTDAVLIAIMRLVAARGEALPSGDRIPLDGILTSSGVERVADVMRAGQSLVFYEGDRSPRSTAAQTAYRKYREAVDPLWRYVEEHGIPVLRREIERRTAANDGAHARKEPVLL